MSFETIDSDFSLNQESKKNSDEEARLVYHFKLKPVRESELELHDLIWAKRYESNRKSIFIFLFLSGILGGVGYVQGTEAVSAFILFGIGITLVFFAILLVSDSYKLKKRNTRLFNQRIQTFMDQEYYEILINEDFFGQRDINGNFEFKWGEEVNIEVLEDHLLFKVYLEQDGHSMSLSKVEVGEEKFLEVVTAVQNKLARIREKK